MSAAIARVTAAVTRLAVIERDGCPCVDGGECSYGHAVARAAMSDVAEIDRALTGYEARGVGA